ncbi:MAG: hypothetical protein P0Y62_14995 [Candidatus Chryseobacterium colombiense]|nr:hypothetical protein [Chryseobacterium sp.]WEK69145.1 MAG: hypothetical protein P0Y62_14995 [Chryseobacterium sp.]
MKKLFNIFLGCASLLMVAYSCEAEQPYYDGDSYVHFQVATQEILATAGTPYADAKIDYGTTHAVNGDHQVMLVLDQANSTAVEGVDFQILNNNTSTLASGASNGQFTIRVLTPKMTESPKFAVFKVQSPTLPSAVFSNKLTVRMSLTCPISNFIGTGLFTNTTAYWMAPAGTTYQVQNVSSGSTNQFIIKEYMDDGSDLKVNYDPTTYQVSIPLQPTGYAPAAGQMAYASDPSTGPASTFNPCTRVLTLKVYWHVRNTAGTILGAYNGGQPATEVFTGN